MTKPTRGDLPTNKAAARVAIARDVLEEVL